MTCKSIRSFAGGLIIAASTCGAVYFFGPSEATSTQIVEEKPSEEEMKSLLTSEGYVILTEEEWKNQLAAVETVEKKTEEVIKETVIYRTMLSVSSGMTSIDVGRALEKAKIIDNAKEFFNKVEKKGLSKALRPGTYEVESDMTMDEVISIIFKK
ncbi:endolytic transglycosylase MltG [Lederbergia citrea]|uniref:Endolytic transglycosylase MltG n=1 Tax=Lederbergia citrea TaxID=2833581 RepID=A0A942UIF3_9BACI|nr:endolytic transglycosylase MltG [Lederbergia citrea]MBS4222055.1 endolytic transglycosylase MltG [Lederbergia citrea]